MLSFHCNCKHEVQTVIRTQIQLTQDQATTLRAMARQSKVSMAEVIRRGIDQYIRSAGPVVSEEERRQRAIALVGRFRSGLSDVSVNHDKYLDEIYGDWQEEARDHGDLR